MPVAVAVNAAERIRYTTLSGEVCETDLLAAFMRAMDDPRIDPTLDQIVDMRAVQRLDVSATGVWQLTQVVGAADPPGVPRRVAIVASSDYLFGMARMYQALRATAAATATYQVFRDMAAELMATGTSNRHPTIARIPCGTTATPASIPKRLEADI